MENKSLDSNHSPVLKNFIAYLVPLFWSLFWLLNSIDKLIGGSTFLFVGKDRFAQIERFFDSIGLGAPIYANIALIISALLEIFAFIFFTGTLYHLKKKNLNTSRSWFFVGIVLTLITFTFFSIGDQIFGDHGELLEHAIYWFMTLLSWMVFINIDKITILDKLPVNKKQLITGVTLVLAFILITSFSIFWHNKTSFFERTAAVDAVQIDANKYKIQFPFLAGSKAFENSIAKFLSDHPDLKIDYIYTAPKPMRLGHSDGLIIYIQTEKR